MNVTFKAQQLHKLHKLSDTLLLIVIIALSSGPAGLIRTGAANCLQASLSSTCLCHGFVSPEIARSLHIAHVCSAQ